MLVNLLFLGIGLYQVGLTILGLRLGRPFAAWFALFWTAAILLMILLPLSRAGVIPRSDVLDTLHASLPLINVLLFGMLNWSSHWYRPDGTLSVDELADAAVALLLREPEKAAQK